MIHLVSSTSSFFLKISSASCLLGAVLMSQLTFAQLNSVEESLKNNCENMAKDIAKNINNKSLKITQSIWQDKNHSTQKALGYSLDSHCVVKGNVNERVSAIDGATYSIGFEMRLPSNWNHRFLFQANGGNDGAVVAATGSSLNHSVPALAEGFAIISSDAGHQNPRTSLISGAMFGHDPQARLDYGYQANQALTPIAKNIVSIFYGRAPEHSYFMGCSNGGRHAMVAASRMPRAFDGFVAGNPGFNLPKAAIQHAWDIQALSAVNPDISKAISENDMQLVASSILERCDDLDGVKDGLVGDVVSCQNKFSLAELICPVDENAVEDSPANSQSCLLASKIDALDKMFLGPKDSKGEQLYSDWLFDSGVNGADWRRWKIQSPIADLPFIAVLGASSLAKVFLTPPQNIQPAPLSLLEYLRQFDFDRDAPQIYATDKTFTESAMQFMTPPNSAKLTELVSSGSKLLVFHGASDGVFSVKDTMRWYDELNKNHDNGADKFARLFVVPGMNHCGGGPATDQFDVLTTMVDWVEKGITPLEMVSSVNPNNPELPKDWSKDRTRKLCPYPLTARYQKGDVEKAESFTCR